MAAAAYNLAYVAKARGRYREAKKCAEESLAHARALSDPNEATAKSLSLLGVISLLQGRPHDAVKLFFQAVPVWERVGTTTEVFDQSENLQRYVSPGILISPRTCCMTRPTGQRKRTTPRNVSGSAPCWML